MKGIYKIVCLGNNKIYISKSIDIESRFKKHLSDLRLNKHHSIYLQNSYNKYGENSLVFDIVEECDDNISQEELSLKEIKYIEEFNSFKDGFNETIGGEGRSRIVTDEERLQMSIRVLGDKNPM